MDRPTKKKRRATTAPLPKLQELQRVTAHALLAFLHPQGAMGYAIEQSLPHARALTWKRLAKRLYRRLREERDQRHDG